MEQHEPMPRSQSASVRPTVALLRLAGPAVAFVGFAILAVISVLHPDRFDRFGLPLALAFALASAARMVALVRRMRRQPGE